MKNTEEQILSEKKNILQRNEEFGFLYKNCKKIRAYVISQIALVPEFMQALREFDGTLDDNTVYEVLKKTYIQMLADGRGYRTAKSALNKVSKDVTGNTATWRDQ